MTVLSIRVNDGSNDIIDPFHELERVNRLRFRNGYPGGLYLDCQFSIPRDIRRDTPLRHGYRVRVNDGTLTVWEGVITDLVYTTTGLDVRCVGYWGALLKRRFWRKLWWDERFEDAVWQLQTGTAGEDKFFVDRTSRLRFVPKNEACSTNDYVGLRYSAPTGTSIVRVQYDYEFDEGSGGGAQNWEFRLRDITNASTLNTVNSNGSGSVDVTLSPVSQAIEFRYVSAANQTPTSNGDYFAEVTNLIVSAEWEDATPDETEGDANSVTVEQICRDTIDKVTELSSSTEFIESITRDISPFVADPQQKIGDILVSAAEYGDTSDNPVAVGVKAGSLVDDDQPALYCESYPALTDYEWQISWTSSNLQGGSLSRNTTDLANYLWVNYEDPNGWTGVVMPSDSSDLTDATSTAETWGQLEEELRVQHSDNTAAINYAKRFLARRKDLQWQIRSPLRLTGKIQRKEGPFESVSHVLPGERIKITDFPAAATDPIFLITGTTYSADRDQLSVQAGIPNILIDPDLIRRK